MKIYIGNVEIAGYFMHLKNGFDKLGIQADLWYLQNNKYYNVKVNRLLQLNQRLFTFFKKNKRSVYLSIYNPRSISNVHYSLYNLHLCAFQI